MPATKEIRSKEHESTEVYLERLSLEIVNMHNTRNFEGLLAAKIFHPNFKADLSCDGQRTLESLQVHVRHYQMMTEEWPQQHLRVVDSSSFVDYAQGIAHVYQTIQMTGHSEDVIHEGMGVFEWKRAEGRWQCSKQIGMRGNSGFM